MAQTNEIIWTIEGMSCANCALGIERYLKNEGVESAQVSFATKEVKFKAKPNMPLETLQDGISKLGFDVADNKTPKKAKNDKLLLYSIIVSVIFTIPLLLSMFAWFPVLKIPLVQFFLCLPVAIIGFYYFGSKALNVLKSGILNMDILVVLGAGAAFIYSCIGLFNDLGNSYLFFETTASIFTIILLGNYIEQQSIKQTTEAIESLVALQPQTVQVKTCCGDWKTTPIELVKIGDTILVKNGETVGTDGIITKDKGAFNESFLTGESDILHKGLGEAVLAGAIAIEGPFEMKATKIGKDTSLQKVIQLVKKAQSEKPNIQKMVDKVSAYFIPFVLILAIFCFVFNYTFLSQSLSSSLLRTIAVLVVACPCAMGLATPTAVIVGVGKLSKIGLLVNNGQVIEELAKVEQLIFDKTGTLTTGHFSITNAHSAINALRFKQIVKSLELHSSHPLAASLVKALQPIQPIDLLEVEEIKGLGVFGKDVTGNTYAIGSYNLAKNLTQDDTHSVYLLENNTLIGWIDLVDEVKKTAKGMVDILLYNNLEISILSGDKVAKVKDVANKLGISNFYAEKLPAEKLQIIENLQKNKITMMVGDGINDAPALVKANVGLSLEGATNVAINAADAVLISPNLENIARAIDISKATNECIKQNLFWAFFYNILMIPLAIFGILQPMFAALAMGLSSVIVVFNALRLKYKEI